MDLQEQYIEDYTEGFNDAALLATFAPEMLSDIVADNNPQTDYFTGFFDGKDYYYEQEMQKELDSLNEIRDQSKQRDNEIER